MSFVRSHHHRPTVSASPSRNRRRTTCLRQLGAAQYRLRPTLFAVQHTHTHTHHPPDNCTTFGNGSLSYPPSAATSSTKDVPAAALLHLQPARFRTKARPISIRHSGCVKYIFPHLTDLTPGPGHEAAQNLLQARERGGVCGVFRFRK